MVKIKRFFLNISICKFSTVNSILFLLFFFICTFLLIQNEKVNENNYLSTNYFVIMEYTKFFSKEKFCKQKLSKNSIESYSHNAVFKKILNEKSSENLFMKKLDRCDYQNCIFTCDKSLLKNSHAVLFHDYDLFNIWNFLTVDYWYIFKTRSSNQIWIYWHDEPNVVDNRLDKFKFNWTISFSTKSEVSRCTYGCFKQHNEDNDNNILKEIKNEFSKRSNSALWFVSNCKSSYRLKYALKLSKFFNIQMSGLCSSYFNEDSFSISSFFKTALNYLFKKSSCPRGSKCELDYLASNKFYLAFESTNCTDYITEKFWRSLSFNLIPVVIQPSKESYERIAPVDSFIHAQDFNFDIELLAKYLNNVSNNFELYLKHTRWKLKYSVLSKLEDLENERICDLCKKLNKDYLSTKTYYESVSSWFNQKCSR